MTSAGGKPDVASVAVLSTGEPVGGAAAGDGANGTAALGSAALEKALATPTASAPASTVTITMDADDEDEPEISVTPAAPEAPVAAAASIEALSPALSAIVDKLRAGRCVLVVGSGLESAVGLPTFRQLLGKLLDWLEPTPEVDEARRVMDHRPFVTAGFVRRRLGDRFAQVLRDNSKTPAALPESVRILGELPFRAIVTTSYSDLFARAFARGGQPPPVYTPTDTAGLKRDSRHRYVLMALGDPQRESTILFTAQEIQHALSSEAYRHVIHELYRQRSMLFLGFSAADIELLFGRMFAGANSEMPHYAVIPSLSSVEAEELEATFGIKSIVEESDLNVVVNKLRAAIGDFDPTAPPDDDDLDGWIDVLTQEPTRADALDKLAALEKRLVEKQDHERLLDLHLGMASLGQTASERARRLREVARLLENHIGDLGKAFTALAEAYKEDPQAETATELERLAQAAGLWTELLQEYASVVPTLPEPQRAAQWVRTARLYAEKLGHDQYALTSLDEALKIDAKHAEAVDLRVDLLRKLAQWQPLAEALGVRAQLEESAAQRADLLLEQGDIHETRLGDGPAAATAYRAALAAEPGNKDALSALEQLHRRRSEWAELVAILDEQARAADGDDARRLRKEAAALTAERTNERKSAIERYEALRADDDRDLDVIRALESLYDKDGRVDDYFDNLAWQAELVKDDKERVSLYRRLGAEWEERPNGAARAAEWYEKLLALEPRAEEALRSVEKLYALDKKWEALVDAYRRHAELPGADRVTLFSYIGQVFESEVGDATRAIAAWTQVVELQPAHEEALAALTRLHEKQGNWDRVLELLGRRAELAKEKDARVTLLHQAGVLAAEKLEDGKRAEAFHAKALGVEPAHVPSMLAMVELYRKSGEFLRAAKLLVEAEQHTQNRLEKTRILVEAGEIYDSLEEHKTATELYLKALAVDPEHVEAGARVAELLWKEERWKELVPVLEMLTRKEADKAVQLERFVRLGRAAAKLALSDKALKAWSKAAELDGTHREAQSARAQLHFAEKRWLEAWEAYSAVLHHHREKLAPTELVDLFYSLGECDRHLGEIAKAKNFYAKALEIDPTHRPTILAQIDVGGSESAQIIEAKKALLATASDEEKVQLLTQIGELYIDKLESPPEAIGAFREALRMKPDARSLLHRCLDIYVEQKDWKQALEMLEKLTEQEQVESVRAKLKFTRAMIHKDELKETDAAIRLLSEAIDDDVEATRAASILEELLVGAEQWKELARFYRKAIKRLGPELDGDTAETRKERLRVWSRLGEITLEKLGERMSALAALEVAATLDRASIERQEQLAELYVEAGPDHVDKAIATHQALLRAQHDRVASYRALRTLYVEAKQVEKANAIAYALSILKKGDPADEKLVAELKARPLAPARRTLDDEQWQKNVAHPDEDRYLDALYALLMPFVAIGSGRAHKDVGLNRKEKVEQADPRHFAKAARYVAASLDVRLPYEMYVRYDQRAGVAVANCVDKQTLVPSLVIGQPLLGERRPERELLFEMGKTLTHLRPERFLRYVLPQAALLGLITDAAIALSVEAEGGKAAPGDVGKRAQELKRALTPQVLEQVVHLGRKLRAAKPNERGEAMATAWLAATELTATRAAFLLLGDLESTARLVVAEPPTVSAHPAMHRLKELIWFSVTEECFAARRHLGLMQ